MTTYTIAYDEVLISCVPDGDETTLEAEIAEFQRQLERADLPCGSIDIERGLILTDDEPDDTSRIVWRGHDFGWLTDENGVSYDYAIRP